MVDREPRLPTPEHDIVARQFDDLVTHMAIDIPTGAEVRSYDFVSRYQVESKKPLEILGERFRSVGAGTHFSSTDGGARVVELRRTDKDVLPTLVFMNEERNPLQIFYEGQPVASLGSRLPDEDGYRDLLAQFKLLTLQVKDRWPHDLHRL